MVLGGGGDILAGGGSWWMVVVGGIVYSDPLQIFFVFLKNFI